MSDMDEWVKKAACKAEYVNVFFASSVSVTEAAKLICARCPVIDHCRVYALDRPELEGTWGGLTQKERRALLRRAAPA